MWVTARVAAKKKTINARLRSGLCVAWLLSLVGCSAGLETEPLVEFSTELRVDGTRPSAVSRQLRSGTYLVEVRERDIDLRVGIDAGERHIDLADAFRAVSFDRDCNDLYRERFVSR